MPKHASIFALPERAPSSKDVDVSSPASSRRPSRVRSLTRTAAGSLHHRVPPTHANPRSRGRLVCPFVASRSHADRPGLPPPARPVSWICQPCFMLVRPWVPTLQRFLPARAARPSRVLLSSLPFSRGASAGACARRDSSRRPAEASPLARNHLAVSRLRGFEPPAHLAPCGVRPRCERMRSPPSALFTPSTGRSSPGCSSPSRMTSRPRPTLLQGSSHGLQSCTRALGPPRGELRAQMYVRSSEFQRTGRTDPILIARQAELP